MEKKSVVLIHVSGKIHKSNLEKFNSKTEKVESFIEVFLKTVERRDGDTLSPEVHGERFNLARTLMMAGIEFSCVDDSVSNFRTVLNPIIGKVTRKTLSAYIPDIIKMEFNTIKNELVKAKAIGIIFDGTTDVCELSALIIRWFDSETGSFKQRLIALKMLGN
jgi:hypothetical protein